MHHIHLDPVGGIAGDMFIAALLDAFPEHATAVLTAAEAVAGVGCEILPHRDHVLAGRRFAVAAGEPGHHHTAWQAIRRRIGESALPAATSDHAIGIFSLLAEAEARVHGIAPDEVSFHEVGAADSIADIVGAAVLIAALAPARWSVAALPLGGGRVRTAHGLMPVPAPATALLLEGFCTFDDGLPGERVTPTGAAILRHLGAASPVPPGPRRLLRSGLGFGTRAFPGISNCLRALVFETCVEPAADMHRELAVIAFEVDDQSAEDLAAGLDRLRQQAGVHDVLQMPAYGKKGRMMTHVQLLARPDMLDAAIEACFRETTTIGLRTQLVQGRALPRRTRTVEVDGRLLRVKLVERPGGRTGKVEADDVSAVEDHASRHRLRRRAEAVAEESE